MMRAYLLARKKGTFLQDIPQPCPASPGAVAQITHLDLSIDSAECFFADAVSLPALQVKTEARARVALDRAWRKRGPPTSSRG